jgi:hypothetical protein
MVAQSLPVYGEQLALLTLRPWFDERLCSLLKAEAYTHANGATTGKFTELVDFRNLLVGVLCNGHSWCKGQRSRFLARFAQRSGWLERTPPRGTPATLPQCTLDRPVYFCNTLFECWRWHRFPRSLRSGWQQRFVPLVPLYTTMLMPYLP